MTDQIFGLRAGETGAAAGDARRGDNGARDRRGGFDKGGFADLGDIDRGDAPHSLGAVDQSLGDEIDRDF